AGSSATLSVQLADQNAHRLSPALLSLGEKGELGIKSVDDEGKVIFLPVEIFSFDPEGVWVGGLPEEVEIITLGAGFVKAGDLVNPVDAGQRRDGDFDSRRSGSQPCHLAAVCVSGDRRFGCVCGYTKR